jgi:hypothetical protein
MPMELASGLLYSQIGYDAVDPKRALVRGSTRDHLAEGATFEVRAVDRDGVVHQGPLAYWGELWHHHWWIADFSTLREAGEYRIVAVSAGAERHRSDPFRIAEHLLWEETVAAVGIEQMEERARQARNGLGWKDCGSDWREASSHATMLIGLCDLLNLGYKWLSGEQVRRVRAQVVHGADFLGLLQDQSPRLGYPDGSLVHEMPNHMVVIPGDQAQAAVAFARASRLVAEIDPSRGVEYLGRAVRACDFVLDTARPYGPEGFSALQRGAPEGTQPPADWMTRDLLMMAWACVELWAAGQARYKRRAVELVRRVLGRQVPKDRAEDGLWGHFLSFDDSTYSEKANEHHHVGHDTGATFPHYLVPLLEMATRWHDHPDSESWRRCLTDFAYGYLLPACRRNPFLLLPMGVFGSEGLLALCGPWHGANTSIAFGASLALRLEGFTGDRRFREIAVGNLQWIAGLHAGITPGCFRDNFTLWKESIPEGLALPYSQIVGIGGQSVGSWTGIRGTIVNGFSTNPQFQLVVKPTREADGPWKFTDEDWIPHGAGWISALTHLRERVFYTREPQATG